MSDLEQKDINTEVENTGSNKKSFKNRLANLVKNKYFWFTLAALGISGTYITIDVLKDREENMIKKADVSELLGGAVDYFDNMKSITVESEIDMFLKFTQDNVTKPYMVGQAVTFDVLNREEPMIHADGKTVFQANSKRSTKVYERYETIGSEKTFAFDNREDLIWVKKEYENQPNIMDSLELFKLIKENEEDFQIKKLFKVDKKLCYMLEGEMQYKDLLPYLTDMVCFDNGDNLFKKVTRNGFYGFVQVYINVETGQPERLLIDFSETGRAFAEVDGGNEGWSAAISTFHFKLNFKNYNQIEDINVELKVKDNAIDEMIFWERLQNKDLTYEELIFYQMLFNYNKTEFDFYMQKLGVTESEYATFLALFNFDVYGNSTFPMLTQVQFNYLNEMFSMNLDFEYYHKLLGIDESKYEYYLNFFANVNEYGDYKLFEGISKPQFQYYQQVLDLSAGNYETYEHVMSYVQNVYKYEIPEIEENDFDYVLNLFTKDYDYKYFEQEFNWTQSEYYFMQQIFEFMEKNFYNIKQNNIEISTQYECFEVLKYIIQNYSININNFNYDKNEFTYYLTLFDYVGSYENYGDYVINTVYKSNEYEYFVNNYIVNNMTEPQFKYYYELILLTNNNSVAYKNIIEFISNNFEYKFKEMTQQEFEYYLNFFSKGNINYEICQKEFNWTQQEFDFYQAMYELIIKNEHIAIEGNVKYPNNYDYYQGIIDTINNYSIYVNDFKYNQIEFEYYLSLFEYCATYQDYNNNLIGNYYQTMNEAQYKYYYELILLSNNNTASYKNIVEFINNNYKYNVPEMSQQEFEYYLNFFTKENISYEICQKEFNWTRQEFDFYQAMYELIIKSKNVAENQTVHYKNEYEYYQAVVQTMQNHYLYMDDFKYNQIEFEYYLSTFKYCPTYQEYKQYITTLDPDYVTYQKYQQYITTIDYATATRDYYETVYKIISQTNNNYATFQDFYEYVQTIDYKTFVQEFNVGSYANIYNIEFGEDAELNSGIKEDGELSNNWYSYSFKYGNNVIGLPVSYLDFCTATGFSLNEADSKVIITAGNSVIKTLYKDGSKNNISVVITNNDTINQDIRNCKITSISISHTLAKSEIPNFVLPGGVTLGMTKDEILEKYGDPYNTFTNGGLTNLTYRSNGRNESMKLTFSNDKLTKVTFTLDN